ncbi:class I SAM-dependent methyltransferase [Sulfitobacter aestuarii]|uniref:Class I SAM-dependent methyltransferase n=1 Tax=Sulfitobacter aestuarii TaxID=2161676 RepID=A0ABW5U2G5_9RHOB
MRISEADLPDIASSTEIYVRRFEGCTGAWLLSVQTEAILSGLSGIVPGYALDIGGGHMQVTPPLLHQGWRVTTLISAPSAGTLLRARLGLDADIVTGDLDATGFDERSFDAVVAMRMMAHVRDWRAFLVAACARSRDVVIIDFPRSRRVPLISELLFRLKKTFEGDTRAYATMTLAEVSGVLEAQGFEIRERTGQFVLPMVLHRFLKRPRLSRYLERRLRFLAPSLGSPMILCARRKVP